MRIGVHPRPDRTQHNQPAAGRDAPNVEPSPSAAQQLERIGIVHLPNDHGREMHDDERPHGEAGDQVNKVPGVAHSRADQTLPRYDEPADDAGEHHHHGYVPEQLIVTEFAPAAHAPVPDHVPRDRNQHRQADHCVYKDVELAERVERYEVNYQAADREKQQQTSGDRGKVRSPFSRGVHSSSGLGHDVVELISAGHCPPAPDPGSFTRVATAQARPSPAR